MKVFVIYSENENETKEALGVFYTKESAELYLI
jgi:hypothetical protein